MINKECYSDLDIGTLFCSRAYASLYSSAVLNSDAVLVYDLEMGEIVYQRIISQSIKRILKQRDLLAILEEIGAILILETAKHHIWDRERNPYSCKLSFNMCIDKKSCFYLSFQAVPMDAQVGTVRFLQCVLDFPPKTHQNAFVFDKETHRYWTYDSKSNAFESTPLYIPREREMEMLRLSKMGYSEKEISDILHCSRDTVKGYRRRIYDEFKINSIEEAIAICDLYHLI